VLLDYRQTPFTSLPSSPSDGEVCLLKWVNYTYFAETNSWISDRALERFVYNPDTNTWKAKNSEFNVQDLSIIYLDADKNPIYAADYFVRVVSTESESATDIAKNDLEHRIYVQKTIALEHGTEEEFADYFSQLDDMLNADDVFSVTFPPAPF
jgi:hypothetical protein